MREIAIKNLTRTKISFDFLKKAVEAVLEGEGAEGALSLVLVGPGRMKKLNKRYRQKNRVTDVLSFPGSQVPWVKDSLEANGEKDLGEVIICLREVKKNAKRFGVPLEQELPRVLIHGILHLIGYDHESSEKEAQKMEKKEEEYSRRFQMVGNGLKLFENKNKK